MTRRPDGSGSGEPPDPLLPHEGEGAMPAGAPESRRRRRAAAWRETQSWVMLVPSIALTVACCCAGLATGRQALGVLAATGVACWGYWLGPRATERGKCIAVAIVVAVTGLCIWWSVTHRPFLGGA